MLTTDRNDPRLGRGSDKEETKQNEVYLVLSDEELRKGYVRPLRTKYVHRGQSLKGLINPRLITEEENQRHGGQFYGYADYEPSYEPLVGRALTRKAYLDLVAGKEFTGGCGVETKMNETIAATYARDPKFYGATYCVGCSKHLPVEEFVWSEGNKDQVVGS